MGSGVFSKFFRYACLTAIALAAAFLAAVYTASPAAADSHADGDANGDSLKNWDSDNLRYGSYTSASFRIPSHNYIGSWPANRSIAQTNDTNAIMTHLQ